MLERFQQKYQSLSYYLRAIGWITYFSIFYFVLLVGGSVVFNAGEFNVIPLILLAVIGIVGFFVSLFRAYVHRPLQGD